MVDGQEFATPTPDVKLADSPSWPEVLGPEDSGSYVYLVPRNKLQPDKLDPKDMEFAHRLMEAGAIKAAAPTGDDREEVTEAVARLIQIAQAPGSGRVVSTAVIDSISGLPKQIVTRIRDNHIELVLPGLAELGNLHGLPRYVVNRRFSGETARGESSGAEFDLLGSLHKLGVEDPRGHLLSSSFQDLARKTLGLDYLTFCRQAIDNVTARNPKAQAPRLGSIDPRNGEFFEELVNVLDLSGNQELSEVTLDRVIGSLGVERKEEQFKVVADTSLSSLPVSFGGATRTMNGSFDHMGPFSVTVKAEPIFKVGQTPQEILRIRDSAVSYVEQAGFVESTNLHRK